ncbi:hypothetical protein ACLI4U_18620 [Natrialbaceae archaeon A-CW2]|uniref:Uncharacterized protein n=1 Tax=Natronosalvus hydrolyticus TaxID=2979988 RepID=A0AAP2ZC87_9EURY|nr:hypothetical protein [Natronosalvus amylolyticus]MCU4754428.1 hypothetical protein [Halobacteria archaeon AArc-curdl1]
MTGDVVRLDQAPPFELLTVLSLLLVAIVGTLIAIQAYRGYRRNDSEPMLYLALGLLLLTLGPFVLNVTVTTLTGADQTVTVFLENVSRLAGLVAITYSLYGTR